MIQSNIANDFLEIFSGARQVSPTMYEMTTQDEWEATITKVALFAIGIQMGIMVLGLVFPVGYLQAGFVVYFLHNITTASYHLFQSHLFFQSTNLFQSHQSTTLQNYEQDDISCYGLIVDKAEPQHYFNAENGGTLHEFIVQKFHEVTSLESVVCVKFHKSQTNNIVNWSTEVYIDREQYSDTDNKLLNILSVTETEKEFEISPLHIQAAVSFLSRMYVFDSTQL